MLNTNTPTWLLGGWLTTVVALVAWSVAVDARLSTSALVLAIGIAPAIVMLMIKASAPAPTVAEILYSVDTKISRS